MADIKLLLQLVVDKNASDLHLIAGVPPMLRIDGELIPVPNEQVLTSEAVFEMIKAVLPTEQLERFSVNKELDVSLAFSEKARFRVNVYAQKGTSAIEFRRIPLTVAPIDSLGLPKIIHDFTTLRQGLVLITGPTGHGKSTTLAAILDEINKTRATHIVTIEDPIEFVFKPVKSIISQREMHEDTHSWSSALRAVLRQDPDVVLVGEMRDFETIAATLTIAETGHLVFATLHTNTASQSVDRIIDVFPDSHQTQVRQQLSSVFHSLASPRLVPSIVAHPIAS